MRPSQLEFEEFEVGIEIFRVSVDFLGVAIFLAELCFWTFWLIEWFSSSYFPVFVRCNSCAGSEVNRRRLWCCHVRCAEVEPEAWSFGACCILSPVSMGLS